MLLGITSSTRYYRGFPFRMATTNIAKNQLQEIFQKAGQQLPQYDVDREVNGTFRASVTVRWEGREMMAYGTGPRKKAAEMDAAENMLRKIMSPVTSPVRNIMPRTVSSTHRLYCNRLHIAALHSVKYHRYRY